MRIASLACVTTSWLVLLTSCGSKGGQGGGALPPADPLGLGVPATLALDALAIGFESHEPGLVRLELTGPSTQEATVFAGGHYVLPIRLVPGEQTLEFRGEFQDGRIVQHSVLVQNALLPSNAVELRLLPSTCPAGAALIASVALRADVAAPSSMLVDLDGDGLVDLRHAFTDALPLSAPGVGTFQPRVAVRAASGVWLCSEPEVQQPLVCLPDEGAVQADGWLLGELIAKLVPDPHDDSLWALIQGAAAIRRIAADGAPSAPVTLAGALDPRGFCVHTDGDWFVADAGSDRVLRYSAALGWQPDVDFGVGGAIGGSGSGAGELLFPCDVALTVDPRQELLRIWVVDSGNQRLQVFDTAGDVVMQLRGDEQGAAPLVHPVRIVAFGDGVAVLDRGAGLVRVFDALGNELYAWGRGTPVTSTLLAEPLDLTLDLESGRMAVLDSGVGRVLLVDPFGGLERAFGAPLGARALALARRPTGLRVAVAVDGPGGAVIFDLTSEPPGLAPSDVVTDAIVRLLAGDETGALEHFDSELREDFEQVLASPDSRSELFVFLGQLGPASELERREPYAEVTTGAASGAQALHWRLQRSSTGSWVIHGF